MGVQFRRVSAQILIWVLLIVTFLWDYGDDPIDGFRIYQWRGMVVEKVYGPIAPDLRTFSTEIDDADKYRVYWTGRAFRGDLESKDSNSVGFKPEKPKVKIDF